MRFVVYICRTIPVGTSSRFRLKYSLELLKKISKLASMLTIGVSLARHI